MRARTEKLFVVDHANSSEDEGNLAQLHKGSPMSDRNKNPYLVTSTYLNCLILHQYEYDLGIDSGNYN
jgi:hypothetical protein